MYKKENTESLAGLSTVTQVSFFVTMQKKINFTCSEVRITTVYAFR